MSEEVRWSLSVQAVGGPKIAASGTMAVNVYSKSQVVVPAHDSGTDGSLTVTVNTTGAELLLIVASQYVDAEDATKILQYNVNGGTDTDITAPLILLGAEAVKLLEDPVTSVKFTNPIEAKIDVDIFVGGDATP